MKKAFLAIILFVGVITTTGQEPCDELGKLCKKYLEPNKNSTRFFISDGQVYRAFVDTDQEAEFYATFYGGSTYRISTSAGSKDNYVIFEVKDTEGNVLFTNADFKNEPYWDFNIKSTLDVSISLKLDSDKKDSGCITMLIGFQQ